MPSKDPFFRAGELWDIEIDAKIVGAFTIKSINATGDVIGDIVQNSIAGTPLIPKELEDLESALKTFSFAAAQTEEERLEKRGLSFRCENIFLRLGKDFSGLVVYFHESRIAFRLLDPLIAQ